MKTMASTVSAFFNLCSCRRKYCDNVSEMATQIHVYYVTIDNGQISGDLNSIGVTRETTIQQFYDLLYVEKHVDRTTHRLRVLDYQGFFVMPSAFTLPLNTQDLPYCVQIIPKCAYYNSEAMHTPAKYALEAWSELKGFNHTRGELSNDVKKELAMLDNRIAEMEKLIGAAKENGGATKNCLHSIKDDFSALRTKLENSLLLNCISPSTEVSVGRRKLKYRRLSSAKQREVSKRFYDICNERLSDEVIKALRLPTFDCNEWADEEILLILQHIFLEFDFLNKFNINIGTLRNFLLQVYKNYNEVPFHNFRHSFCVTQMMYVMIHKVDLVNVLGHLEILVLLTSCICHDLDHPGYNNIYQINAHTELAIRYNDISPLENHHCSVTFHILQLPDCNIFENFDDENFRFIREGIIRCILATDMSRHTEILNQFKEFVDDGFDFELRIHINSLCMVLIKVADISNEARPMPIADPWLDKLFKEFFTQSDEEKELGLPVTPFMDKEKITKPSSQCSFIQFVLLPLFEALGNLFIELDVMIVQPVRDALDFYRKLNDDEKLQQRQQRKSLGALDNSSNATSPCSPAAGGGTLHPTSTSLLPQKSEDMSDEGASNLEDLSEEEDLEPITEVAVSERTLKFKISTERLCTSYYSSGSKSHPGSRKGSREKAHDFEMCRPYRCDRPSHRASGDSGTDKRSWSSSENTNSSIDEKRTDTCQVMPERTRHHSLFATSTTIPERFAEEHRFTLSDKFEKPSSTTLPQIYTTETSSPPSGAATAPSDKTTTEGEKLKQLSPTQEQAPSQQQQQTKQPSGSNKSSPDLKRLMNRVVRDFRGGNKSKIANGVKNSGDESNTSGKDSQCNTAGSSGTRQQHKEQKSSGWMSNLFQNIRLRGSSSHDQSSDSHN